MCICIYKQYMNDYVSDYIRFYRTRVRNSNVRVIVSLLTLIKARSCCSISVLRYLQPVNKLSTPDEVRLPPSVTQEVNRSVQDALRT